MGTGSGYYDNYAQENGLCGHCVQHVHFESVDDGFVNVELKGPVDLPSTDNPTRYFRHVQCPECFEVTVWTCRQTCMADRVLTRIFPPRSDHPRLPVGTPAVIAKAYEKACRVLAVDDDAAAALARRAIQLILREELQATGRTLYDEIQSVTGRLPPDLLAGLHSLRELGNFAAHPEKDELTGQIIETTAEEATLTVAMAQRLAEHLFGARETAARLTQIAAEKKKALKP